jgi:mono/diheme cytochrome c family protein
MRIVFVLIALSLIFALLFAGCKGATSSNPGGHTPEEIARAERQGPPPPPQAPPPQPASTGNNDGEQLYNQYCGVCHADGKSAPSLAGVFKKRELPSGTPANDARVKDTIKMGRAMMPAFTNVLNDDQVNAIIAYLHTQ